jgi:hypothetical protein
MAQARPSLFLGGDFGVTVLLEHLKSARLEQFRKQQITWHDFKTPRNCVFVRFELAGDVLSGLILASSESDASQVSLDIQAIVHEKKGKLLTLQLLSEDKISPFPFFVVCSTISEDIGHEIAAEYWLNNPIGPEAIRTWLEDFLRYRRDILYNEVPDLEAAVPFVVSGEKVFGIFSPPGTVALRYYLSRDGTDTVEMRQSLYPATDEEAFRKIFVLPSEKELVQTVISACMDEQTFCEEWGHPYFAGVNDLMAHLEHYNSNRRELSADATYLTNARLHHWTTSYIQKMRELALKFPKVAERFKDYIGPVTAVHFYNLDDPRSGWIRDGSIHSYYLRGHEDRVETARLDTRDEVHNPDELLESKFGLSPKEAFLISKSSIAYYLRDKLGLD